MSQHFFGSGINGNHFKHCDIFPLLPSQHFFGSGINGNNKEIITAVATIVVFRHNTSSEVELMETKAVADRLNLFDVTTLLRKWN